MGFPQNSSGCAFGFPEKVAVGELTVRHWSNAGIRLPNHGQDFVTLTIRLNSGRFESISEPDPTRTDDSIPGTRCSQKASSRKARYHE